MKKYTQKELLEEGTWQNIKDTANKVKNSRFGKIVGGAAKLADYAVQKVAPEARQLYMTPINTVTGAYNAATGNTIKPSGMSDKLMSKIANGLQNKRWALDPDKIPKNAGVFNGKQSYNVNITDLSGNNKKAVIVDQNGNILSPSNMINATGPAQPNATPPTAPTTPPTAPTTPPGNVVPFTRP